MVGLSRLGLALAVGAAAAAQPITTAERGTLTPAQYVRKSMIQSVATPASVPPPVLPPADNCASGLALRCARVPALADVVKQLHDTGDPESTVCWAVACGCPLRSTWCHPEE